MPLIKVSTEMLGIYQLSWWKFILFICFQFSNSWEVIVVYEKNNLIWRIDLFYDLFSDNSLIEWHNCEFAEVSACFDFYKNAIIVLDLTLRIESQFFVSKLCKEREISHLIFENKLTYIDQLTLVLTPSYSDQIRAFISLIDYFRWNKGLVIYDEFKNSLKENLEQYSENFNYLIIESEANIAELVNRIITPLGATLYYVFMNSDESYKLQNALISAKVLTKGNGIVLDQKSGYNSNINGALIICVKGQEFTSSEEYYLKSSVNYAISYLLSHIKTERSKETLYYLNSQLKGYYRSSEYSLINIQDGERIIVGKIINGKVSIFRNIIFPGNTEEFPESQKKKLHLSIEAGSTNPTGPAISIGVVGGYGSYIACDIINNGDSGLLENFQIELTNFDCGVSIYNATFANECYLKDKENFGIGHIAAWGSVMAIGSMKSFNQLNLSFPIVSATNGDTTLSSTANFPMYMRVQLSYSYAYSLVPIFIRALGWEKVAVLYQNDTWGLSGYYYLTQSIKSHDLTLINPESSRAFQPNLDRNGVKKCSYILQEIIDCQARFLIFIFQYPTAYYIFEEFYDLGLRRGDLVFFTTLTDLVTLAGYDNMYTYKVYEIAIPIITTYGQSWVGPLGTKALEHINKDYGGLINSYSCFYFDALFLIAYALDYMVNRGLDYTDPNKLQEIMRKQQFYGCTGMVIIEKGSNDRIVQVFEIIANKLDNNGNLAYYIMGEFRPQSTQLIKIQEPLIYADGSITKPTDLRSMNYQCPFPDRLVKTFAKGRVLVFGICFAVALVSLIITIYIWKRWWKISIEPLIAKKEISLQDAIVASAIVIEFFQYSSMGPDFSPINSALASISDTLSLRLDHIIKLKNGVFWIVVNAVFGSIGLWLALCTVIILRLDEKFPQNFIFRNLNTLADYFMPILGDLCFIPFISVCLDIFLCDQSIGDNFTDSFLAQDCYYFCWKDEHLAYAILSFFALTGYVPLAVFCRPLWQELQPLLHVKATPLYLMVKTMVQIFLIVINKTVKRAQSTLHGILFLLIMIFYIVFLFKFKPYNYSRFSWWQTLILIGVVWLAFLSIISLNIWGNQLVLTLILCSGFIIIGVTGIYMQYKKYPSLLFRKKAQDASSLFRFAFAFGKNSKVALSKIYPNIRAK